MGRNIITMCIALNCAPMNCRMYVTAFSSCSLYDSCEMLQFAGDISILPVKLGNLNMQIALTPPPPFSFNNMQTPSLLPIQPNLHKIHSIRIRIWPGRDALPVNRVKHHYCTPPHTGWGVQAGGHHRARHTHRQGDDGRGQGREGGAGACCADHERNQPRCCRPC